MNPLRLVLVTRRYWPLVGSAETAMSNLAAEFLRLGNHVTVVTAQWEKHWPHKVVHREVPVVRLPQPYQGGWGTLQYMRALSKWLEQHHDEFDLAFVSMLRHDAYATIGSLASTKVPVVLRVTSSGESGDCQWHGTARFGRRIARRSKKANALFISTKSAEDELRAAGYSASKTYRVETGVPVVPSRDLALRNAARKAFGKTHDLLAIAEDTPLVVYAGPFYEAMGLADLVNSWPTIASKWPRAKLWLSGEGPDGESLWKLIRQMELASQIIMPGSFDDLTEVFHAADVFVQPCHDDGQSTFMLQAIAAGLAVVATETPDNRELMGDNDQMLVSPHDTSALSSAIVNVLSDSDTAQQRAATLRNHVYERFPLEQSAIEHLQIFKRLITENASYRKRPNLYVRVFD